MTAQVIALKRRKGRAPRADYAALRGLFPRGYNTHRDWLYAFGLADGRVKLGRTGKPHERIRQHIGTHGVQNILWTHLFAGRAAYGIEKAALHLAAERGSRVEFTEYFRDLTKAEIIACGREAFRRHAEREAEILAA